MATKLRIGTCSWADQSLLKYWYPRGIKASEERLRHYADNFDTVEVDSTYYRLPAPEMVERWAERTPDDFVMHVKAFGMMTRHPVKLEALPPDLREHAQADERGRVDRPPRELRAEVFARFHTALEPLRAAGKLGGILLQFPSYIVPKPSTFAYLEWAHEQLRGDEMLVEFRHRSWLDDEHRADVLSFLEERRMTHVVVDAPKTDAKNLVPTVQALTTPTLYLRFHGRNAGTWNIRGKSAAERFDYLYSSEELREWVEPLRELTGQAEQAYAFFNNNGRSPGSGNGSDPNWVAQAPTNAFMLRQLLADSNAPAA
ncbi:MAG: DUF72 domain-containing protein [Actinobacteria bacterium]|nr:DUF72 domain-containing protein [Actinomycetota bacterium]